MELLIGAIVTGVMQIIKKYFGTTGWMTYLVLALLSLAAALVYYVIVEFGYWEIFYKVVLSAGAIYAFIVRPLTNNN